MSWFGDFFNKIEAKSKKPKTDLEIFVNSLSMTKANEIVHSIQEEYKKPAYSGLLTMKFSNNFMSSLRKSLSSVSTQETIVFDYDWLLIETISYVVFYQMAPYLNENDGTFENTKPEERYFRYLTMVLAQIHFQCAKHMKPNGNGLKTEEFVNRINHFSSTKSKGENCLEEFMRKIVFRLNLKGNVYSGRPTTVDSIGYSLAIQMALSHWDVFKFDKAMKDIFDT
jgi:hypothetical protein